MKKLLSALILCLLSGFCLAVGNVLNNPALTPVNVKVAPVHEPLKLVENGKLRFAVVIDGKQSRHYMRNLQPAIKLIQEAFLNTTGQTPQIFSIDRIQEAEHFPVKLLLGTNRLTKAMGLHSLEMEREGFEIKTAPGTLAIVGFDSMLIPKGKTIPNWNKWSMLQGTLWGTYDFVERFMGCRFYFPGEYGSVWPKITDLTIPPIHYEDHPYFLTRDPCWVTWSFAWTKKGYWDNLLGKKESHDIWKTPFYQRWRLAETTYRLNHNPNPVHFAKEFPDKLETIFYRSPNGILNYDRKNTMACYFDILNYKFADLLIEAAQKKPSPNSKVKRSYTANDTFLSFGQADNELPLNDFLYNPIVKRENLITKQNIASGSAYSDIYARFYKYLGERIKKDFPGRWLYVMPYAGYTKAPLRDWQLPDNLQLRVCIAEYPAWIPSAKTMEKTKKQLHDWSKAIGGRPVISLWLYNVPNNPFARAIVPEYIGRLPKLLGKDLGRQDLFFDQYGLLEWYYYYSNYVAHKSMWNPNFNVDAALDEHWTIFYGEKAAPALRRFHAILKDMHEHDFVIQSDRNPLYPKNKLNALTAALEEADRNIPDDSVQQKRFDLISAPWAKAIAAQDRRRNYSRPVHGVTRILQGEKIVLDGKGDEPVWQRSKPVELVHPQGYAATPKNHSSFRLAWDDNGIYILYQTQGLTVADTTKNVWKNSNIECFFIPGMVKKSYYHYAFSAAGQKYTASKILLPVDMPYNDAWKSPGTKWKVTKNADNKGWNLECFIPYGDLDTKVPKVYSTWFANLISCTSEFFSSSMTIGNNHNYKMYGMLKFLGR